MPKEEWPVTLDDIATALGEIARSLEDMRMIVSQLAKGSVNLPGPKPRNPQPIFSEGCFPRPKRPDPKDPGSKGPLV